MNEEIHSAVCELLRSGYALEQPIEKIAEKLLVMLGRDQEHHHYIDDYDPTQKNAAWFVVEAYDALDHVAPWAMSRDSRTLLAGLIAGKVSKARADGYTEGVLARPKGSWLRWGLEEIGRCTEPRAGSGDRMLYGIVTEALGRAGIPPGAAGIPKPAGGSPAGQRPATGGGEVPAPRLPPPGR